MIFFDPSEARKGSRLPKDVIATARSLPGLEAYTGADLLISPLDAPLDEVTDLIPHQRALRAHCDSGCLIQRKRGLDLPSSLGPRINGSLARMGEWTSRPTQRVLLFIGILTYHDSGLAVLDGMLTDKEFWSVQAALSKWHDRGGVVEMLCRDSLLLPWLQMKERHLRGYTETPIKEVWPETTAYEEDSLQRLRPIKDQRITLATLPGIGAKRATALWDALKTSHADQTLAQAIVWLLEGYATEVHGIGDVTVRRNKEWFGMKPNEHLTVYTEEETEP